MLVAGGATGAIFGALGVGLDSDSRGELILTIAASVMLVFALREFGWLSMPVPSRRWQVPARWVVGSSWRRGAIWGIFLGPGFLTRQQYPVYHAMILWIVASGEISYGIVLGACFAFIRALPVLLAATPCDLQRIGLPRVLLTFPPLMHRAGGTLLSFSGMSLMVTVLLAEFSEVYLW